MFKINSIFKISPRLFHSTQVLLSDALSDLYREKREEEMKMEKILEKKENEKNLIDDKKINIENLMNNDKKRTHGGKK